MLLSGQESKQNHGLALAVGSDQVQYQGYDPRLNTTRWNEAQMPERYEMSGRPAPSELRADVK